MGSSRFPGKMLARLGDFTVLEWVLWRVSRSQYLDGVLLATSDCSGNEPLVKTAEQCGVSVFRGDEQDVLQRFVDAAQSSNAEWVVRVCADNPFIDSGEIDRLVQFFACNPCDYACNHQSRLGSNYADGFGAEILSHTLLAKISARAKDPRYREHVTLYIWDHLDQYDVKVVPAPAALARPDLRFDVDTPQDLARLQRLLNRGVGLQSSAEEIVLKST